MKAATTISLAPCIVRSLKALQIPSQLADPSDRLNARQSQQLVLWLEETRIRLLSIEERKGLQALNDDALWRESLRKYLEALGITIVVSDWDNLKIRNSIIERLVAFAVEDEFIDIKQSLQPVKAPVVEKSPQIRDCMQKTNTLLEDFGLPVFPFKLEEPIPMLVSALKAIQARIDSATGNQTHKPNLGLPLGFPLKLLRLLHVSKLKELQRRINSAITELQEVTADPKTNTIGPTSFWQRSCQRWQNLQFRLGRDPRRDQRRKIVVLGTGWGAINFIRNIDVTKFDVVVVSPKNYFSFTPLLPSVCAGTLCPRACMEPVREMMLRGGKRVMTHYEAAALDVVTEKKAVRCRSSTGKEFDVNYDILVLAVGCDTNTFGIPGVKENACFLKDVSDARAIHSKLLDKFEQASLPGTSEEEQRRLLHFVVVGGGPTGVETAAEIADFVKEDARRHFPDLLQYVQVTLVEMLAKVLPVFSPAVGQFYCDYIGTAKSFWDLTHRQTKMTGLYSSLLEAMTFRVSEFALANMKKLNIDTYLQSAVTGISEKYITLKDSSDNSTDIPYGFVLWASGLAQVPLARTIMTHIEEQKKNRILRVNPQLRVIGVSDVYALGDCSHYTPKLMADDAKVLFDAALSHSMGPGITWLMKNADFLSRHYPQIHKDVLDLQKLENKKDHCMYVDEFKEILEQIDRGFKPPPPTAQVANQEAKYLARTLNKYEGAERIKAAPYIYRWKGQMAYVGNGQSVIQVPQGTLLGGHLSNVVWKVFYWSEQMSVMNRCAVLRGRDIGRGVPKDVPLEK